MNGQIHSTENNITFSPPHNVSAGDICVDQQQHHLSPSLQQRTTHLLNQSNNNGLLHNSRARKLSFLLLLN
jgi:hypothetical protein